MKPALWTDDGQINTRRRGCWLSFVLVGAMALVNGGCPRAKDKKYEALQRQLSISELAAQSQYLGTTNFWSLPNQRRFSVTLCLEDQAKMRSVGAHTWNISGPGIHTQANSAATGCLSWQETVDFEPGAPPIYIPFERTVSSASGEFEPMTFSLRLNPWSGFVGNEPEFNDPRFPQDVKVAAKEDVLSALSSLNSVGSLIVREVSHEFKGINNELTLDFAPQFKTLNMEGAETHIPIEYGKLDVLVEILYQESTGKPFTPVHLPAVVKGLAFRDGLIHIEGLKLPGLGKLARGRGQYHLRLALNPVGASAGLKPFAGVFLIGSFEDLGASTSSENVAVEKPVEIDRSRQPAIPVNGPSFELATIGPSMDSIPDEDSMFRHVTLVLNVSVSNPNPGGKTLEGEEFKITPLDKPDAVPYSVVVKNGKLTWRDFILHNYYEKMSNLERQIKFTHVRTGDTLIRKVELTPWVRFFVLFTDNVKRNEPTLTDQPPRVNAGQKEFVLRLESPCFTQDQRWYSIDPLTLDLKIDFPTTFRFNPVIRRYDEPIFGMNSFEGLRPGYYLLTMAVYNLDLDKPFEHPISAAQKIVHHAGGNLSAQLNLALSDLSFARLRNFAALDIKILDPKTLKLADGRIVNPLTAYEGNLPVVAGDVVPQEKLGLHLPVHVFPFAPSADGCSSINTQTDFEEPRLKALVSEIESKKLNLPDVYKKWESSRKELKPTAEKKSEIEKQGWKDAAARWGLRPLEILSPADSLKIGYQEAISPEELESTLECFYQINEQNDETPAKCQFKPNSPVWRFCQAIGLYWNDTAVAEKNMTGLLHMITAKMFPHCFNRDTTRQYMKVRKYIHPYEIATTERVPLKSGFVSELGIRNQMTIGTDYGSEFMHEHAVNLAIKYLGVKGSVTAGTNSEYFKELSSRLAQAAGLRADDPVAARMLQSFQAVASGVSKVSPNVTVSIKGEVGPLFQSFRWAFHYDIPYVYNLIGLNSTLVLEDARLKLDVQRFRTCYSVEADMDREDWESLLIDKSYEEGFKPRLYLCFPPKNEHKPFVERYFFVYNNPGRGAMLDNDRASNRWFFTFRGERDYYVFLENLRARLGMIFRGENHTPEAIMTSIDNLRATSLLDRPAYAGTMSAPRPGAENFDSVSNLEGGFTKFMRWMGQTFNPWYDYDAPHNIDQNNPENRHFNREDGSSKF